MSLRIRLIKRAGKPALLSCRRADGSTTTAELAPGPAHDLAHYVVESALGFSDAFYSLLARGMDIQDFNVSAATTRLDIPEQAVLTEFIVGLLQTELLNGEPYPDFDAELRRTLAGARRPCPPPQPIGEERLGIIRARLSDLIGRWRALPPGGALELEFPAP